MIINELKEISNIHHLVLPSENCIDRVEKLSEVFQNLADCLMEKKDYMAELQAKESGKPIRYGRIEVERCINQLNQAHSFLRMYFSNVKCILEKKYIPLGNILAITTFSSPYSSFFHKMIPSIICGDTFVFLPSPKVYQCSKAMFLLTEACLSKFFKDIEKKLICVNTQLIDPEIVLERIKFRYILFTGKSQTAAVIKKKIGYCHGLFETGSCAMAYVDKSVTNLDKLAEKLVCAAFAQSGMRCIGLKNLFIQEEISKTLIEKIVSYAKQVKYGNPLDQEVMVGPILDPTLLLNLRDTITLLKNSGYIVLTGGTIENNILRPTIFFDMSNQVNSIKEMYGPILCIHIVKDFRSISRVYYKRSSLNTAFFSENDDQIHDFINYCNTCGTICINCGPDKRNDELPFGGLYDENDGKEDLQTLIRELSIEQRIMYEKNV